LALRKKSQRNICDIIDTRTPQIDVSRIKSSTPHGKLKSSDRPLSLSIECTPKGGNFTEGDNLLDVTKEDNSDKPAALTPLSAKDLEEDLSHMYR